MKRFLRVLSFLVISSSSQASVIVNFDNPGPCCGYDSRIPQPMVYIDPGVTSSKVTNSGVVGVNHIEMYQTSGWGQQYDPNKYISWSVAANVGNQIHFDGFDISIWVNHFSERGSFSLRSSADGFSSALGTVYIPPVSSPISNTYLGQFHFDFDLDASQSTATEFRLSFFGGNSYYLIYTGNGLNGASGFTMTGEVTSAVPEPGTHALFLAGLGALVFFRARRAIPIT